MLYAGVNSEFEHVTRELYNMITIKAHDQSEAATGRVPSTTEFYVVSVIVVDFSSQADPSPVGSSLTLKIARAASSNKHRLL